MARGEEYKGNSFPSPTKDSRIRPINRIFTQDHNLLKEPSPFQRIALDLQKLNLKQPLSHAPHHDLALQRAHAPIPRNNPNHRRPITGGNSRHSGDRNAETMKGLAEQGHQQLQLPRGEKPRHRARRDDVEEALRLLGARERDGGVRGELREGRLVVEVVCC